MNFSRSLAVLGSLTIDEVFSNGRVSTAPGGSALYVSTTSSLLGTKVDVVSRVGVDYPSENLAWLRRKGVRVGRIERVSGKTCRFRLRYRDGFRTVQVVAQATNLGSSRLEGRWGAIHIGSVFREVPIHMVPMCRQHSPFLSMDLQGFVRRKGAGGRVLHRPARLGKALSYVDLVKTTAEEALVQTRSSDLASAVSRLLENGPKYVVVTMGKRGAILALKDGKSFRIPAYPEKTVVDPTGSGDAMMGGWLATFLATKDPLWAICVGAGLASLLVREKGLAKFHWSKAELFRRAAWVYGRTHP